MRFPRVMAVVTTAAAGLALALPAAPASATVTGAVLFACQADLPTFPSATLQDGTCGNGSLPSAALGVGAGLDDSGNAYAMVGAGLGNFSSTFTYDESNCVVSGTPPATGTASGTATLTGATAVDSGATGVQNATLTTHFTWTRVGSWAVILTDSTSVSFSPSGLHASGTVDVALAAFLPFPGFGVCGASAHTQAQVVGLDVEPV
jgi:hypothetical protein